MLAASALDLAAQIARRNYERACASGAPAPARARAARRLGEALALAARTRAPGSLGAVRTYAVR